MGKKVLYFITSEDITGVELAIEHTNDDDITILLLQNAVYFANKSNKTISQALEQNRSVKACKEDIDIRGLSNFVSERVKLVASADVIDMIFANDTIINM
jgi:sulfur relay protein TusB/DsrH